MRTRGRLCGLLIIAAVVSLACGRGRDTPTGPTRPVNPLSPLAGSWIGTAVDEVSGAVTLEIAIAEQVAISLSGSWTATFADPLLNDRGTLSGSAPSSSVTLLLESTTRTCGPPLPTLPGGPPVVAMALQSEGNRLTGTYFSFGCGPLRAGRVEMMKQ